MKQSGFEVRKDGTLACAYGPDAMAVLQARTVSSGLRLYNKTGILLTRGAKPSLLLQRVEQLTGKKFKNTADGREQAAKAVDEWASLMTSGLPVTTTGSEEEPA